MAEQSNETKIRSMAEAVCAAKDIEFVHLEVAGSKKSFTVTIYIDKEGGVSVDDCAEVSREIEALMDADDLIESAYILEVSSPGLERELYSLADFEKFIGNLAKIRFIEPVSERKSVKGVIDRMENGEIVITVKDSDDLRFNFENVKKANLQVDLNEEFKKRR